jgi:hypothetical protein
MASAKMGAVLGTYAPAICVAMVNLAAVAGADCANLCESSLLKPSQTAALWQGYAGNLSALRALAFAASSSRLFGAAFVSSE